MKCCLSACFGILCAVLLAETAALAAPPPNDNFANRIALRGAILNVTGSNVDATAQAGEPEHWPGNFGKSVWWSWTAPNSGPAVVTTAGTSYDSILAVYTGNALNALTLVGNNDDFGGTLQSGVEFAAAAGTVYQIAVDGIGQGVTAGSGNISLHITNVLLQAITLSPFGATWKYLDNGSDPGINWSHPTFDDAAWASGPAQLGYGDSPPDEATVVSFGPNPASKFITTYFRRTFNASDIGSFATVTARDIRDDGIVVYLNGAEVYRFGMPVGTVTAQTLATANGENTPDTADLTLQRLLLRNGVNLLAAEVHQQRVDSSDISFDLELTAARASTNQPPNVNLTSPASNGSFPSPLSLTLAADAWDNDGAIVSVEFQANGSPLNTDTTFPYSFAWNGVGPGNYQIRAIATDNRGGGATSSVVTVTVTGVANQRPTVSITFPPNNSTFDAPTNLLIQANANDPDGAVTRVEFFRGTEKLGEDTISPFNFAWLNALVGPFQLTAIVTDNNGAMATSAPVNVTFTGTGPVTLVPAASVWKFLDDGSDQGTAWRTLGFNDSGWASGPAQLGYGDNDEATVVGSGPDPGNKFPTTYFRQRFSVPNPSSFSFLTMRLLRDDGAIVYINGTEVFRSNMPGDPVDFLTLAVNSVALAEESLFFTNTAPTSVLVAGNNIVAVEIHQQSRNSSDISFDFELVGNSGAVVNNPPTVGLTTPVNNATFTEPASILINANAADSDGNITRLEFFAGPTKLGEDNVPPYSFNWTGVGAGNYALRAIATDNLGGSATSAVVNVFVTGSTPPTIASRTPAPGNVSGLTQITVQFSEPVDGVNASDLLINGVAATNVAGANATYTFTFPQPIEGAVTVRFAAGHGIADRESPPKPFDAQAANAMWQYQLTDTTAPTVARTFPAPGATVRSLNEIEITFSEPVANVQASDLRINGLPANDLNGSGAGPYRFRFAQPANGAVNVAWVAGHGIRDFAAAQNAFAGGSWSYTLATNLLTGDIVINEIMYHPQPESTATEYIELFNRGATPVNLTGWRISRGVNFTFPNTTIAAGGYLVVAADLAAFNARYPGVTPVVGPWLGTLANTTEQVEIEDASGNNVDSVTYADEGDWAVRVRGPLDGWIWVTAADEQGHSMELVNPVLPGNSGQNWNSSVPVLGTPGTRNSRFTNNAPPLALDLKHFPPVPKSTDSITFTVRVVDEQTNGLTVALRQRNHSSSPAPAFGTVAMLDDGAHGDGLRDDGIFGVVLPAQANGTILEYYVEARDAGGRLRTWPAAALQADQTTFAQTCNALLQVDDENYTGDQPVVRVILTESERQEQIAKGRGSDAEMNVTFIISEGTGTDVRQNCGFRYRGASSRGRNPPGWRLNIPKDRRWNGRSEFNLNSQYTFNQTLGAALAAKCGLPAANVRAIQMRLNAANPALESLGVTLGSYAMQETMNAEWAQRLFPDDGGGNAYRCVRPNTGLAYLGTDPGAYVGAGYSKQSNSSENDWTDLFNLTQTLNDPDDTTYAQRMRGVANLEEWMLYFAACQLMEYSETALCNGANGQGVGDDYSMYRGEKDPRFRLLPHDFDTIFGEGDTQGNPNEDIFQMRAIPSLNRFMPHPEITPIYYRALRKLADTVFAPAQFDPFIDSVLGSWVDTTTIDRMKAFNVARRSFVLSQIPANFTNSPPAPVVYGPFPPARGPVGLSEVLARNDSAVPVGGRFPDLIELRNTGGSPVNLGGWGISDEADNPFKFTFAPSAVINAGQFLTLYADNETAPAGIHVGFTLKAEGDEVYLTMPDGLLVDSVTFGMQVPNLSVARMADGDWSLAQPTFGAANVAAATGNPARLKINEWLTDGTTPIADDFIELFNPEPQPVALGGLFLTDTTSGTLAQHKIPQLSFVSGGGYAVFIADGNTGAGANHVNFKLSPAHGTIGLYWPDLNVIDCVVYGPQRTDVSQGRRPNGATTLAFFTTPTPGSPNPAPIAQGSALVINEVLANNISRAEVDNTTPDWVEIYNPTPGAVNLADMSLSDDPGTPRRYVFPSGTIPSLGYFVIRFESGEVVSPTNTGFGLKARGGAVYLFDRLANGGSLLSSVVYGPQAPDYAIGRVPDGGTNWFLTLPTRRAANFAQSLGNAANLRVNEWMANPASGDDWFEIYNGDGLPVALGGLHLTDNLANRTKFKIAPLSFIGVSLHGYQRFEADNNTAAGPEHVNFGLNNGGEALGISTAAGALIDAVSFGAQAVGVSQGRLPDGTANIVSFPTTASPGDANYLLLTNVVINEVMSHSDLPLEDAIELRNLTAAQVNIGGWFLSDAKNALKKYRIPNGTILPPNGFKVFYEFQFNDTNAGTAPFSLNSAKGDEVYLAQTTTGDALTGFRAQVKFDAGENSVSFGRYVTSDQRQEFVAMTSRTFGVDNPDTVAQFRNGTGLANSAPKVGPIVISEIMYHPPDLLGVNNVRDEFIELQNISANAVPLFHPQFSTNTWRLRDAVKFDFPPSTAIPAGGFLLVVSFDPVNDPTSLAAFRARYNNLAPTVPIVGPYQGTLENNSDSIELYKPDAPQLPPDPDAGKVPYILVERVRYSDLAPWPVGGADGGGQSLQRLARDEFGNDPINWTAAAPTPGPVGGNPDTDNDGMPDTYELANGFNPNNPADANQDADNDGRTNLQEYLSGTNPRDANSVLRLRIVGANPPLLQVTAAAGVSYTIEGRPSVATGTWTVVGTIPAGAARTAQITDGSATGVGAKFYRLRTP